MGKKFLLFKRISFGVACILFILGAALFWESHIGYLEFEEWLKAEPVNTVVDFSKSGYYESTFVQTCSIAHGEVVGLLLPEMSSKNVDVNVLLNELDANCIITDSNNNEIAALNLPDKEGHYWNIHFKNFIPLGKVQPFYNGTYKISILISKGTTVLTGIEQHFVTRYELCGLERMPAVFSRLIAYICFVISGFIFLIWTIILKINKRKQINILNQQGNF